MAFSERQKDDLQKELEAYCTARIPERVRDQLRLGFRLRGNEVVLFEQRRSFQSPHGWSEFPIAKFKYIATERIWRLYCQHRDLRWHEYEVLPKARSFRALLAEVDADPTGIFFG